MSLLPPGPAHLDEGYFVAPTVFRDVDPGMRIAQEEIYGPVLSILRYDDADHAVAVANDSRYGLGGAVFGVDEQRAVEVARRIETGNISVNL
ncbi:aldehyde dehydrogenase family protein [Nocardioides sp. 31GB23]|uniref:aldehyde dehydrogenase family protein n=1 Tax=Nocardioides sp. 31GB23 TaxID=3156065 RepID=UPI0032AFAC08